MDMYGRDLKYYGHVSGEFREAAGDLCALLVGEVPVAGSRAWNA
jgi:hypothetical protein